MSFSSLRLSLTLGILVCTAMFALACSEPAPLPAGPSAAEVEALVQHHGRLGMVQVIKPDAGQASPPSRPPERVSGGDKWTTWAGSPDIRRLQIGPSTAIHRLEVEPTGGVLEVQSGSVSSGPQGGDGGVDEHPGGGRGSSGCTGTRCAI